VTTKAQRRLQRLVDNDVDVNLTWASEIVPADIKIRLSWTGHAYHTLTEVEITRAVDNEKLNDEVICRLLGELASELERAAVVLRETVDHRW